MSTVTSKQVRSHHTYLEIFSLLVPSFLLEDANIVPISKHNEH